MPTYEYECPSCGHQFELMQKMTDPPKKHCPRCRKKIVRKLGTGTGIIFKGSGFYATDYRSPDYKAKEKAEKGGASGGGTAAKSGSESSSDKGKGGSGKANKAG